MAPFALPGYAYDHHSPKYEKAHEVWSDTRCVIIRVDLCQHTPSSPWHWVLACAAATLRACGEKQMELLCFKRSFNVKHVSLHRSWFFFLTGGTHFYVAGPPKKEEPKKPVNREPTFPIVLEDKTVKEGDDIVLKCKVEGNPRPKVFPAQVNRVLAVIATKLTYHVIFKNKQIEKISKICFLWSCVSLESRQNSLLNLGKSQFRGWNRLHIINVCSPMANALLIF